MAEKKKHAGHGYRHTHMEHHHDGSITMHHEHEDGPHMDRKHAVANLDGAHDSMEDHLGQPNADEAALESGQHGVPEEHAAPAGLPASVAPASIPGTSGITA